MKSYHYYSLFDLSIQSEIELPFLEKVDQLMNVAVSISISDDIPYKLKGVNLVEGVNYSSSEDKFLFEMVGIARYYVKNGSSIQIAPSKQANENDIALFLMNPIFIVLLNQRGMTVLHASAVEKNGKAFLLSGAVASGISSLTAGLLLHDFNLVTDDLCVITQKDHQFFVEPYFNGISLWKDVVEDLAIDITESNNFWENTETMREDLERYQLSVKPQKFTNTAVPICGIFQIIPTLLRQKGNTINLLEGSMAFSSLLNQLYFSKISASNSQKKQRFSEIAQLSKKTTVSQYHLVHHPLNVLQKAKELSQIINLQV